MRLPARIISFLFLVVTTLPITFCIVTEIKHQQLKYEAKQKVENLILKTIVLSPNEFQWTEAGKEISIHGDLFDIKSYSLTNGKFIFYGLFDKEETALDQLEHNWRNNREENKLLAELFQVLQSVFHNSGPEQDPHNKLINQYPYLSPDKLSFQPKKIITPPPQA